MLVTKERQSRKESFSTEEHQANFTFWAQQATLGLFLTFQWQKQGRRLQKTSRANKKVPFTLDAIHGNATNRSTSGSWCYQRDCSHVHAECKKHHRICAFASCVIKALQESETFFSDSGDINLTSRFHPVRETAWSRWELDYTHRFLGSLVFPMDNGKHLSKFRTTGWLKLVGPRTTKLFRNFQRKFCPLYIKKSHTGVSIYFDCTPWVYCTPIHLILSDDSIGLNVLHYKM